MDYEDDTDDIVEDEAPTFGELAADKLRNGMGSWNFIFGSLLFLAGWIGVAVNSLLPIDNPQLTILNLILSCIAALQGGILLISARRQDQLLTRIIEHISRNGERDLKVDRETRRMVKQILEILNESRESAEPVR